LNEHQIPGFRRLQAGNDRDLGSVVTDQRNPEKFRAFCERALHGSCIAVDGAERKCDECQRGIPYNRWMQRKMFWLIFIVLGLLADFLLPLWWAVAATLPIVAIAWWAAYRSDWF